MKTLLRRIVFMCGVAVSVTLATAQITFTDANVGAILAPPNALVNRTDTLTTSLNIGVPGGPNTWNFSGLATSTFQRVPSVPLSTIPSGVRGNYPTATHAFAIDTTVQGISGTIYQFLQLNSSGLRNLGATGVSSGLSLLTISITPNPEVVYGLSATQGFRWQTAFTSTVRLLGAVFSTTTHDSRYFVDAYGRMTMPDGRVHDALRIRKYNLYNGSPVLSYIFLARGGAQVQAEASSSDTTVNSGTINIRRKTLAWNHSVVSDPLDVRLSENGPAEFSLQQNFPNPFNPSTRIIYQVAKEGLVSLRVFNLLGQEVTSLVNEIKAQGTYQLDWTPEGIPSGVYFYKMQSGSFTETKRMVFLK